MERLEQMMENKHNFKNYRDRLAKIKTNGEPTLPYLGTSHDASVLRHRPQSLTCVCVCVYTRRRLSSGPNVHRRRKQDLCHRTQAD